jgi:hypothetical protein
VEPTEENATFSRALEDRRQRCARRRCAWVGPQFTRCIASRSIRGASNRDHQA